MVKIVFEPQPKGIFLALQRFSDHDLGPQNPHFRPSSQNILYRPCKKKHNDCKTTIYARVNKSSALFMLMNV